MKILKEEILEEHSCPNCDRPIEWQCNEMIPPKSIILALLGIGWTYTKDGWFTCKLCNKRYLIKDYTDFNQKKGGEK